MAPAPRQFQSTPYESMEARLMRAQRSQDQPARQATAWEGLTRLGHFLRELGRPMPRRTLAQADALPCLFPKVRPASAYAAYARSTGKPVPEFRPLAGGLAVSLVVDTPNQDQDLDASHLLAWNADFDDLLCHARRNLLARSGEQGFEEVRSGCYRSTWRDNLDGSRMLLPGVLGGLRLQGDPVVVLPNRDTLLVVGADDPEGLRWAMLAALQHLDDDGSPMSACPLRLANYQWQPFEVGDAHPIGALLGAAKTRRQRDERVRRVPLAAAAECC